MNVSPGSTVTLPAQFRNWQGTLTAPTVPTVSVIDSDAVVRVAPTTPDLVGVGLYTFDYLVPVDGPEGLWTAQWAGVVDGALIEDTTTFIVGPAATGGVCTPWATLDDVMCDVDSFPVGRLQSALTMANALVNRATLGLFGVCTDTVRPCSRRVISGGSWARGYAWPVWSETGDVAGWPCHCGGDDVRPCGCGVHRGLTLPAQPVREIIEVVVDGEVVDDVVVLDHAVLLRGDGLAWPCCQHLDREPAEPGTFQVVYTTGADVPPDGVMAVASLACELAKAWSGGTDCRLPRRVTSVVSEGVTVAMAIDSLDVIREGWFGVPEVDGFIASVNPDRLARQGTWLSVDTLDGNRRVTFP